MISDPQVYSGPGIVWSSFIFRFEEHNQTWIFARVSILWEGSPKQHLKFGKNGIEMQNFSSLKFTDHQN